MGFSHSNASDSSDIFDEKLKSTSPTTESYGFIPKELPKQWVVSLAPIMVDGAGIVLGLSFLVLAALYWNQEKMLYIPEMDGIPRQNKFNPQGYRSPSEYGIRFEEAYIKTADDVSIHSWLLLQQNSKDSPTIVFFHGNAGNIGLRLPNANQMYNLLGCNVLMVEYRGYGDSQEVKPTEEGLFLDAQAAMAHISQHSEVDRSRIFLFGRSLGGAVSLRVAQHLQEQNIPVAGVMLENCFLSVSQMVNEVLPILVPVKKLLLKMKWDNEAIVPTLKIPILFLAGDSDEIVPFQHMQELHKLGQESSSLTRLHVVRGGNHNESWIIGGASYWAAIKDFLDDVQQH